MLIKPDKEVRFNYKIEEGINPYIGFMSFQHFRGEKLYSDSIVKLENNMTETEAFECYPIPDDVEENGREQGYYPDSSVAYIRILWKEFEPKQGEYNFKFIEDIIADAKAHNQSLTFRLMPHSTRSRDDVPEWLKSLMVCPERPDGKRVKDSPLDPLFIDLFCNAIRKIGERFDDNPVFDAIDISLPGAWGEGHNVNQFSTELIQKIVDTYTTVFKKTQLMGQLARPDLIYYASKQSPIGWRGDGLGDPFHTEEYYPPNIEKLPEVWKKAPVSFEAYWWLGEWKRQGWDIDIIIEKTLQWHISSFNAKSLPIPYEWKDKVDYWVSRMGYHFSVDYFCYPSSAQNGDILELELGIDNCGVAPIYRYIPLKIRIVNSNNSFEFETPVDIRNWMPGKNTEKFNISLPQNIADGEYRIEVGIYDEVNSIIYLCTDAERDGSYYKLGEMYLCKGE